MMHRMGVLVAALLAGCSPASDTSQPQPDSAADAAMPGAPPKSPAEALITRLTWPQPQRGPFAPRDGCGQLEGAYAFRIALAEAVMARDADALAALAAPGILLDFGGGEGVAELRRRLDRKAFGLWGRLDELMSLGCAPLDAEGFVLPSFFGEDIGAADPFKAMIVTGADVPLRAEPKGGARVLRSLSWDRVGLVRSLKPDRPFQLVRLDDGTTGYLPTGNLRSLLDYRLLAQRMDGAWRITAIIAGD